jgi:peptidoglycan-associated lipoprotein
VSAQQLRADAKEDPMKPVIALMLVSALAACSHARPAPETEPAKPAAAAPEAAPAPAPAAATPPPAQAAAPVPVPNDSLYFDFDRSDLTPQSTELLARLGPLLAQHSELHLRVEGNCDERGSEEYNIALGQRRAGAAKKYLVQLGARDDQITARSYGKDKPRAQGHDEESWRQNRRDDLIPDHTTLPPAPVSANP